MNNDNTSSEKLDKDVEASFGDAWISVDDIVNECDAAPDAPVDQSTDANSEVVDTMEYDTSPLQVLRAGLEKNKATVADMKLDELLVEAGEEPTVDTVAYENNNNEGSTDLFIRKTVALSKEERLEMLGFCDDDSENGQDKSTFIVTDANLDALHERAQQLEADFTKQESQKKSSKRLRGVITSDLRSRLVPNLDDGIPTSFHAMGNIPNDNEIKSDAMFGSHYFNEDQTIKYAPKSKPRRAFSRGGYSASGDENVELYLKLITFLTPFLVAIAVLVWYLLSD